MSKKINAMQTGRRRVMAGVLALGAMMSAAGLSGTAHAANYPERPITLIVPFGPGGGVDNISRRFAQELGEVLGQTVIVENRSGAGSAVGVKAATRAPADGYTLLIADAALVINELLGDPPPYEYDKTLKAVSMVSSAPYILVGSNALEASTVDEIVKQASSGEKGLTFASAGVGTAAHMTGELFRMKTKANLMHVPYRSGNPAMTDLVAGQVDIVFTTIASAAPFLAQGRAKGIATTGRERSPEHPDLPTLDETLGEFEVYFWTSLFVPADTPADIVETLTAATHKVLERDAMKAALKESGNTPKPLSAADTEAFIKGEAAMWTDVIKKSGLKIN